MDSLFFSALLLLVLFVVDTHSTLTPQEYYWRTVLPNTPMSSAIRDMMWTNGKPNFVLDTNGDNPAISLQRCQISFNYCFKYGKAATQVPSNSDSSVFFLDKDLHPGAMMKLDFLKTTLVSAFIPREEANSIPFSSEKLLEILSYFSFQPNSLEAETIKHTLETCERDDPIEKSKYCSTSLESMVDFALSSLGTHDVRAVSTEVVKEGVPKQLYTVASPIQELTNGNAVACHPMPYPYRVFYCHATHTTRAYMVTLVGGDGSRVKAVAVCHTDTSAWDPRYIAFQVLKVKPGTVPVCHFLPQNHIVWTPIATSAP